MDFIDRSWRVIGRPIWNMQAYVLAETEKWGKVAKFAGIKPE